MSKQFWVLGSEYDDCGFERPVAGTSEVHGPFTDYAAARAVWAERSAETRHRATMRFQIVTNAAASNPGPMAVAA